MKRDIVVAVGAGFLFGIFVAFVVLRLPALLQHLPSNNSDKPQTQSSPTPSPTPSTSLTITQPTDGAIIDNKQVTVSGTALQKDTVVVFSGSDATVAKMGENGLFTATIDISEGVTTISVIATKDTTVENTSVTVYYTPEAL